MAKKLISSVALLCMTVFANAGVEYMTVEQNNGAKYSFLLNDNPVVTYEDGYLVVNGDASTSYAIDGVRNFHFTMENETGVETQIVDIMRIVNVDESTVAVENAPAGANVVLVSTGGATVATTTASESGYATIGLPSAKGVYVLTVGRQSFKVIRK